MSKSISEIRAAAGSVRSRRKTKAVRENGKLGGRPANPEIARIMEDRASKGRPISRQRAHQIFKEKK